MNKDTLPVIIRNVDRKTWTAFRMICLSEGVTATDRLKIMISIAVEDKKED